MKNWLITIACAALYASAWNIEGHSKGHRAFHEDQPREQARLARNTRIDALAPQRPTCA
ncbi:MAG: hypothetical protein JWM76_2881 [Pseudonocardiales bacterium]|nr:hypothetical protein [Pseudonocardiales bacterium]